MKKKIKKILLIAVSAILLLGVTAMIVGLTGRAKADEGYELVDLAFERGSLDENGKYVESKAFIYTKTAFDCDGEIKIKLDFESNVNYQVYFYDVEDHFVESTEEFDGSETVAVPENATCARLVVSPIWDADVDEDDKTINVWQVNGLAGQLTVMVAQAVEAE